MTVDNYSEQAATGPQSLPGSAPSPQSPSYATRQEALAARRANLSTVKQALIDKRLRREAQATESPASVLPRRSTTQDYVPLSLSQEPLWFQEQLNAGTTIYNISSVEHHAGPFNLAAFEQSVHTLRERHEALRARFVVVDGAPVQIFDPPVFQPLPYFDLRPLPRDEQAAVGQRIAHDVQRPFDLSEHSLLRVAVVQIADEEHVVLLTMHHMVADGWSMRVLVEELSALYTAFASAQPSPLAPLPTQYGDFACWQRQWLHSEEFTRLLAYWQRQLAGAPQVLTLPTDRPRPAKQTYRGSELPLVIPATLRSAIGQFGALEQSTLFMVLLATFQLLLARLSGQEEIVVGTPVAGRSHPALNGLIGCFVNSLVMRTDLRGNPSFRELVQRVRQVCLDGYAHQDMPFGKLVEALQPTRTLSYSPVFQVMFDLRVVPQRTTAQQPTQGTPIEGQTDTAKYDVVLALTDDGSTLDGSLIYNTDLFDAPTIERMRSQFLTLLEAGVAQPEQRITVLPLLEADEYRRLLVEWSGTRIPAATASSILELFTAQAERTPAADAVVAGAERLSYGELHRRSNQLAQYLRSQGVGGNTAGTFGEMLIGICTERSLELAIGLLGILKAGAAYVPLDPAYPADRLAWMVEDAHIQVLLTQAHLKDRLAQVLDQVPERKLQLVCLDQQWPEIAQHSGTCLESRIVPEHPAYVIYTSGSTGRPKGVLIPHRALIHHCQVIGRHYAIQPSDRVLQWSALSFDVMAEELFPAWTCGATVVFRSEQLPPTISAFLDFVASERLTILNLPTPYWHAWVAALGEASLPWPPDLRLLVVGSDVAHAPQLLEWRRSSGDRVRWLNAYGATETTITATIYEPDQAELVGDSHVVPIGRALANVQAYILDRRLQLLPVGVPGELHIGGAGLARGYLNHQTLTAERFIPDPFSNESGSRLYKTGDLVRWRADGNIEFLDRVDQQIKVRGYRIEPGEIEAVLLSHSAIGKAVVVAINDGLEGNRLVAYVVANQEPQAVDAISSVSSTPSASLDEAALKHFLQGKLPEYMVPSAFVVLPALPLAPSGKIDRQALPLPSSVDATETSAFIVPRDTLEMQLVQIWQSVLGHPRISVTDDFFRLGGHSLLAVRLMDMIQRRLGRAVPLSTLFQSPTVERLAQHLRRIPGAEPASPLIPIQPNGSQRPFFCVHPLGGSVFCYAPLMRQLGPDQPSYGLEAIGMSGEQPPHERIEEMAAAYIAAIQTVQPAGPYRLGGWSFGGVVAFEMAQQLQRQGHAVSLLALFDCKAPQFEPEPEMDDKALMSRFVKELGGVLGKTLPRLLRRLQQRRGDQRLQWIWKQLGATGLVPPDVDLAYIEQLFKVFAANERALRRYSPQPSALPIVLFLARMSFDAPAKVVDSWQQLNDRSIAAHTISGNHFSMLNSPHVDRLAEHLQTYLSEAEVSRAGADALPSQALVLRSA